MSLPLPYISKYMLMFKKSLLYLFFLKWNILLLYNCFLGCLKYEKYNPKDRSSGPTSLFCGITSCEERSGFPMFWQSSGVCMKGHLGEITQRTEYIILDAVIAKNKPSEFVCCVCVYACVCILYLYVKSFCPVLSTRLQPDSLLAAKDSLLNFV